MTKYNKLTGILLNGLLVIFLILFFTNKLSNEDDYFWHLNTGKYILQNGFPVTDVFNWVQPEHTWYSASWLWDVITYQLYAWFGYNVLTILSATIFLIIFYLLYILLRRSGVQKNIIFIMLIVLSFGLFERLTPRPHLITYLFTVIFLYLIIEMKYLGSKNARKLYFIPIIMMLWVNLHTGFLLGLFILTVFYIDALINVVFKKNISSLNIKFISLIILLSFAAIFINPYGYKLIIYITGSLENQSVYKIGEWISPLNKNLSERFYIIIYYLLFFAGLSALYYGFRKRDTFIMILTSLLMINSLRAIRYTTDYELTTFIFIVLGLSYLINTTGQKSIKDYLATSTDIKIVLIFLLTLLIYLTATNKIYYSWLNYNRTFGLGIDANSYPVNCMKFINDNKLTEKNTRIFNTYEAGGFLSWQTGARNFIDSRLSNPYLVDEYDSLFNKILFYQPKLKNYNFDMTVYYDPYLWMQPGIMKENIYDEFAQFSDEWKLIYWDDATGLFIKNKPENADVISKYEYKYVTPYNFIFQKPVLLNGYKTDRNRFMQELNRRKSDEPNSIYISAILNDYVK